MNGKRKKSTPSTLITSDLPSPLPPSNPSFFPAYLSTLPVPSGSDSEQNRPLDPEVTALKQLVEYDSTLYTLFHQMFERLPNDPLFHKHGKGRKEVIRNYKSLFVVMDMLLTEPPHWLSIDDGE